MGRSKVLSWFSICFYCVLFTLSVVLYYFDESIQDIGLNIRLFATILAPAMFFIISAVFDNPRWMMENNRERDIPLILLPVFVSLHFMVLTMGFMAMFSEALILWYGLLLLPLLILVIYIFLAGKYAHEKIRMFTLVKYGLSIVLFVYGFIIFWAYGLAGLGI